MAVKHIGFQGAENHVMAEGYSPGSAARIIGAAKARASASAKKANPHLLNTPGHFSGGKPPKVRAISFRDADADHERMGDTDRDGY
jgi:hypothetical protein